MSFGAKRIACCAVFAASALSLCADDPPLEDQFRSPPLNGTRPCVSLDMALLSDEVAIERQLGRLRELGAGGVLLAVPAASDAVWERLGKVAARARQLGIELGVRDFAVSTNEAASRPRACKLVWSSHSASNAVDFSTNSLSPVFLRRGDDQMLARLAVPATVAEIAPHEVVDLTRAGAPTGGVWRVYAFGLTGLEPERPDGFDGTDLFRHVNRLLFESQNRLRQTYGSTLLWCQFSGAPRSELVWPRDLPELFLKKSGLGLSRYYPALAGVPVGGAATAAYVRQQVRQAVTEAWRARVGSTVNELVHEAGLEAGIRIDEAPVDPEEVALYFRRPTLTPANDPAAREANVRAAGGARAMGRRYVVASLSPLAAGDSPDTALDLFSWKAAADRLFCDGATRLLLESDGGIPSDDAAFRRLREGVLYAHRCQVVLQQGHAVADYLVWTVRPPARLAAFSCDYANATLLSTAAVKAGSIRFDSERAYGALAVTAPALQDKQAERMARQLAARGVRVWLVPDGEADEEAVFTRVLEGATSHMAVWKPETAKAAGAPEPDFIWTSDAPVKMRFLHRRSERQELYFLVNESLAAGVVSCSFRDAGQGAPSRWNPASGESSLIEDAVKSADGRVSASLFMAPHDACFVVFDR